MRHFPPPKKKSRAHDNDATAAAFDCSACSTRVKVIYQQQQQYHQQYTTAAAATTRRGSNTRGLCVLGVHTHELCCTLHIHTHLQAVPHTGTLPHTLAHTPHTPSLFIRDCSLQPCVLRATVGGKPKKKNGVCRGKGQKLAHCLARLNLPAPRPTRTVFVVCIAL